MSRHGEAGMCAPVNAGNGRFLMVMSIDTSIMAYTSHI
jgi:hypothetical protein